jgi:hypothetical protein
MGWIRVLAFNEQGRRWFNESPGRINQGEGRDQVPYDQKRDEETRSKDGAAAPPVAGESQEGRRESAAPKALGQDDSPSAQSAPGTGWGDRRRDPVRRVWFVPEHHATDHLVFRYEYASGLRALGIFPRGYRDRVREREDGELGFAQAPRW